MRSTPTPRPRPRLPERTAQRRRIGTDAPKPPVLSAQRDVQPSPDARTRCCRSGTSWSPPDAIRSKYRALQGKPLITALAKIRLGAHDDVTAAHTLTVLRCLARRVQHLEGEIVDHDKTLSDLVRQINPALIQTTGIGIVSAADLLVAAGDNPDRITSEGAFAALCGTSPVPASSGKTIRHRLNRGGNRTANCALHRIAVVRLHTDQRTRAYAAKQKAAGRTSKEILRCLKRAIAREVYHLLVNHPRPSTQASSDPSGKHSPSPSKPSPATFTGRWPPCPSSNADAPPTAQCSPPTATTSPTGRPPLAPYRSIL